MASYANSRRKQNKRRKAFVRGTLFRDCDGPSFPKSKMSRRLSRNLARQRVAIKKAEEAKPLYDYDSQGREIVKYKGKTFVLNEDGFLLDGSDNWCGEWVDYVKHIEGITDLTDEHQKVIDTLQEYYRKNGIAPMVRMLSKTTGFPLRRIYELFPSGPGKGACKMAGLPKPASG